MRNKLTLITVFTSFLTLVQFVACTYDYFEDETNYEIFVPQVKDNTVSDCRIMIYNEVGELIKKRHVSYPWGKDPNLKEGLFRFKLLPGNYKVYCYTNTGGVVFQEETNLNSSNFILHNSNSEANLYEQPSDIFFDKLSPKILHPGIIHTDTTDIKRYTSRITVRFKNFPEDITQIKNVQLIADGISTLQYLKKDTLTSCMSENDKQFNLAALPIQNNSEILEVDHRFFPSIKDKSIRLNYTFTNQEDSTITSLQVDVLDKITKLPIQLLHGKRIIIEFRSDCIISISIVGWNEDIESSDTNLE